MNRYKEAGVNPVGGCLPMLVQMPIWFALYRALYQLAGTEPALKEGFFWIPSLAGPTINGVRSLSWLWPFPPAVGWPDAIGYLVLPVLLVVSQLYMQKMMTPQSNDPQQKSMGQVMMFMPFMFGYFALVVPSGLSLYWFTNNLLSLAQQLFINKQHDQEKETKALEAKTKKGRDRNAAETTKSKRLSRDKRKVKALPVEPEALEDEDDAADNANGQPENDIEYKTSAKQVQIDVKIKSRKRKK